MRRLAIPILIGILMVAVAAPAGAGDAEGFEQLNPPGGQLGDLFGYVVAVDGNRVVVGAPLDRGEKGRLMGSVWVFTRAGVGWHVEELQTEFEWRSGAGLSRAGRLFGVTLDIAGDRIVVGSPGSWEHGAIMGAVSVFDFIDGEWIETSLAPDELAIHDQFGYQVVLSDDGTRLMIGTLRRSGAFERPGKVFLYDLVDGEWLYEIIQSSDGKLGDEFGSAIDMTDDLLVAGAPMHSAAGKWAGAVYIYERVDGEWAETKIVADDAAADARFGSGVAIFDDLVLVGDRRSDEVYFIRNIDGEWRQEKRGIVAGEPTPGEPGDPEAEDEEDEEAVEGGGGGGMLATGDLFYVADYGGNRPYQEPGALQVLEWAGSEWVEIDRYEGSDFGIGAGFGWATVVDEDLLVTSAPWLPRSAEVDGDAAAGSVFVRGMPPACGPWQPTILGTAGDDVIVGTPGDDVILPGTGSDVLHVSAGADVYCLEDGEYHFTGQLDVTRSGVEGLEILVTTGPAMLVAE